jgi:hypothetical protein
MKAWRKQHRRDGMMMVAFMVLLVPVYQGGCHPAAEPEPHPAASGMRTHPSYGAPAASGEDRFDSPEAIEHYQAYSDGAEKWTVLGGSLLGIGPANQSVLIRRRVEMADGWVEAVSSRADDGGLVLRFRAPDDYYLLAFRDDAAPAPRGEYNLALYHHVGSEYREIRRADIQWTRGTRRTIRFEAEGPRFRAYVDGEPVMDVIPTSLSNDPAPNTGPGGVGVRNFGADPGWITKIALFRWHEAEAARSRQ